uniref:Uncharacterized protein n=1 Tax=Megaselia scalaris TaxID=36166 RepID=T1GN09_MEGSC
MWDIDDMSWRNYMLWPIPLETEASGQQNILKSCRDFHVRNWGNKGPHYRIQALQTFFGPMQHVYHFNGNLRPNLNPILVFGCGQLSWAHVGFGCAPLGPRQVIQTLCNIILKGISVAVLGTCWFLDMAVLAIYGVMDFATVTPVSQNITQRDIKVYRYGTLSLAALFALYERTVVDSFYSMQIMWITSAVPVLLTTSSSTSFKGLTWAVAASYKIVLCAILYKTNTQVTLASDKVPFVGPA